MNLYAILSAGLDTHEASALSARLSAWHDEMVAHERRLQTVATTDACHDECPHAEARTLWAEAVGTFGARAQELTFLRSRAQGSARIGGRQRADTEVRRAVRRPESEQPGQPVGAALGEASKPGSRPERLDGDLL
jgi:hypothetical protein